MVVSMKVGAGDVGEKKSVLEKVVEVGKRNRQLGLYLYIVLYYSQHGEGVDFGKLHRFYNNIAGHVVCEFTVSRQLDMLESRGLIEERGGRYYPRILDLEAAVDLFDKARSRAGRLGAVARLRKELMLKVNPRLVEIEIPKNLKYYVEKVVRKTTELAEKGRRLEALDLIVHTLLPLRENGVLWVWWRDTFIYYEPKAKPSLHSVKAPLVAELLKKLGFEEGIMAHHTLGHEEASSLESCGGP